MGGTRIVIQKPINALQSGVETVTGQGVDNTDPRNPVLSFPNTGQVAETTNKKYVSDNDLSVINNTSNTNTGDETTNSIQNKRPIKTVNGSSLEGNGNVLLTGSDIETSISSGTTIDSAILALQTDKANQSEVDSLGSQVSDNRVDLDSHILDTSNPHDVTPLQLGLQNVDNTSDVNKPISNDTQSALNTKIGANNYATFDTGGTVKMSRDSATSTTYISFDGSDTPNVT